MRLATYWRENEARLGLVLDQTVVDVADSMRRIVVDPPAEDFSSMLNFLQAGARALKAAQQLEQKSRREHSARLRECLDLADVRLAAPIPRPGKIIALGLNYREHAEEQGIQPPSTPLIFAKFSSSATGPYDPIVVPSGDPQVDYEVELCVVIGRRGKRIPQDQAFEYVAGYMVLNDVSARQWQFADKQWVRGKSCDTFAPMGPWLTTKEEIPDPHSLDLETRVNGEVKQRSNTRNMIFRIPAILSFISASITLDPGDVIATGTPLGVGMFSNPPTFLQPGDLVETTAEKLGSLRNRVIGEERK